MTYRTYRSNRIYLDFAASTPVASEVLKAMKPYFSKKYGNPGSLHSFGQEAMTAVDKARETIAKAIDADFREVIFTGSATEANNLALRGVVRSYKSNKSNKSNWSNKTYRIIVSAIEHESILETARVLEDEGGEVIYLPVDKNGLVDLRQLKNSLNKNTILVSVMYANNEIGTIQPIAEIAEIIKSIKSIKSNKSNRANWSYPFFHTDAVQAFQFLNCDVNKLGIDLMTLSAHKIYGPKGIGALFIRPIGPISPIITGGGQEFGFRSGTENIPSIIGFAKAVELASNSRESEKKRVGKLRDYFWQGLKKIYPAAQTNPETVALGLNLRQTKFLPNILNVYFPGQDSQDLLIKFDLAGIAVSSGAACRTRSTKPSPVLQALGFPSARIKNSIRFSLGRFTTKVEITEVLKKIKKILK